VTLVRRPSITYWNRVEPSPRGDSLQRGLEAAVRDPLWFLTRQWQLGEFQGEDAASPAYASFAARLSRLHGWRPGKGPMRPYDGSAPLEPLSQNEATTPDVRTAVEIGQALEDRLAAEGAAPAVIQAFRAVYPVPRPNDLDAAGQRDRALVRFLRVCGGRATHGVAALRAAAAAAPDLPDDLTLPPGGEAPARAALTWLIGWARETWGLIGVEDADGWRPNRLEYALEVAAVTPDGDRVRLRAHTGPFGELDWYAFDQIERKPRGDGPQPSASTPVVCSMLPTPVSFSGMPHARWWHFEDARFNWAAVDTDRRELGKVLVVDFMLVQGNDWFMVPFRQDVGTLVKVDQLLVRDVFGDWTLVRRADADPAARRGRWTMFSTTTDGDSATIPASGLADWFLLPPGALRVTVDGPDVEEVRFVRDEQANMVWAVEVMTESASGRPWPGRERAQDVPDEAPPPPVTSAPLRYRLQTTVPVNWIPFVPVQVDAARRAVALERAAMPRLLDGALRAVAPAGRVLRPTNLADPDTYRVQEEEIARTGTRVLRADRRTRWTDGSIHLWTSRRRRAGMGETASGLRYDLAERTE
jgi:hypothetical protein